MHSPWAEIVMIDRNFPRQFYMMVMFDIYIIMINMDMYDRLDIIKIIDILPSL